MLAKMLANNTISSYYATVLIYEESPKKEFIQRLKKKFSYHHLFLFLFALFNKLPFWSLLL